jgi:glycosyltransferase involved in cell wall biosynthesis
MKIVLLHYAAPPVVGGVESVISHHARLMVHAGHEVSILAGRGEQTDQQIPFIQVPMADSRHPLVDAIKKDLDQGHIPLEFPELVERLAEELWNMLSDADCLIAHNVCSLNKNLILTAALKKLAERPNHPQFILWHHDLAWTTPRYRNELHAGHPWDLLCTAWEGVEQVTISEFRRRELAELMKLPEEKIWVIPNGLDVAHFLKLEKQTLGFIDQLDLLKAAPILILPVRITPRKNIELALEVMAALRKDVPLARLIVTGPLGPHNPANIRYFEELRSLRSALHLDEMVHFLAEFTQEYLPDEVVSDFYQIADALLLPSREEGFGIPILEAGLVGMPVFCADIPPLRDLGLSFVNYFSLDEDPAHIASMLADRLSTSPLSAFRARIRSEYTWGQVYQRQIQPLLERVNENGSI